MDYNSGNPEGTYLAKNDNSGKAKRKFPEINIQYVGREGSVPVINGDGEKGGFRPELQLRG